MGREEITNEILTTLEHYADVYSINVLFSNNIIEEIPLKILGEEEGFFTTLNEFKRMLEGKYIPYTYTYIFK